MNLQRREEISVLLAAPVTGEAGQALEYRDALMECRTHIDTMEQAAAERVIADGSRGPTPDYTGEGSAWVPPVEARSDVVRSLATRFGLFPDDVIEISRRVRAIPADRLPGEGMVAVTPEYLNAAWGLDDMSDLEMFMWFRDNQEESGPDAQRVAKIFWKEAQEWKKHQRKKLDALRANQGEGRA